ncbi:MAG TPA: methyltransferase domain-containing protein [Acidobacteriota bacterium]|nr:methyltransferase domain-containing protein [Acidobacteriota bacterium]
MDEDFRMDEKATETLDMRIIDDFHGKVLPVLRCVACGEARPEFLEGRVNESFSEGFWHHSLRCKECGAMYPVTRDYIPVVWSPEMKKYLEGESGEDSPLTANMTIYDKFSSEYKETIRVDPEIPQRLGRAVERIGSHAGLDVNSGEIRQIDIGCGPGHTLEGLKGFGMQQFGLDVSLSNLRNTRRDTGAMVVCGDAVMLPFADKSFQIVTSSAVLHHLLDWQAGLREFCRICDKQGGVILDSEPSKDNLNWGLLARFVWRCRQPVFKVMSLFSKSKFVFRDDRDFNRNLVAEIHNLPGRGFGPEDIEQIFSEQGFAAEIIPSPDTELKPKGRPNWKLAVLHLLSGHNPWHPKYGQFMAIAVRA